MDNLIQHEERRRKIWADAYCAAITAGIGTPKYTANNLMQSFLDLLSKPLRGS